jgi:thiamine-monophosphate kinase
MDVSDGLADDLGKLCKASGISARIFADRLPVLPALKNTFPDDWLDLALYGGEDYVLLFTAPPDIMDVAIEALPDGAAVIGEIVDGEPGTVTILDSMGNTINRSGAGWDHFIN